MKRIFTPALLLLIIACACSKPSKAQDIANNPVDYLNAISTPETQMNKAYMAYISAAAHSSRKRKIEKLRLQTVDNIVICQSNINYLPPFKGDNSFRQSSVNYVQLCYKIFNEDYVHIVNMEDIAERSYDEMQAYLLLQQATNDTLQAAVGRMRRAEQNFAMKYHVNMVETKTELGDKMAAAGRLAKYRDKVFLLFYKCNWEDNQMVEAMNQKNVSKIEQVRSALDKYAVEGLAVLDTLHAYENDASLADACKQALTFYKTEAETGVPGLTDFFLKEENFNKLKTAMESKASNERTRQDVENYNKAVAEMNDGANAFNQTNASLNAGRNEVNKNWMDTEKNFTDVHTPYYK